MRIAYVCADPGVPVFGRKGASVHVQEVLRVLLARGARVDLFCRRTGGEPDETLRGVRVHELPRPTAADVAARELTCLRGDEEMADALRAAGPFDLVYERYSLWSRAGMAYARGAGVPGVLEVNAPLVDEQARHRGLVHRAEATAVVSDAARDASVVVAVSAPVAAWVRATTGVEDVLVQPNGVDVERIRPAASSGPPFTVGFVGTLKPWHGVDVLVRAFATHADAHPDSRLLLVGEGPERDVLTAQVRELGLERSVRFTGAVDPAEIPRWLHRMDVAVAPYPAETDHYFSPLKIYEYLAAGLPVVASRIGQVAGVLVHDHDGVLVPPGDADALAAELTALHEDEERRTRLGRVARRTAERHTWADVVTKTFAAAGLEARQVAHV